MTSESVWVSGRHAVIEGLRAGTVREVMVRSDRRQDQALREILALAASAGISVVEAPAERLQRVASEQNTQGVVARAVFETLSDVRQLLEGIADRDVIPFLLVLDQVQDPHNVGALMRTADAAGVQGILLPQRRSASLTGIVARTSAGALGHLAVAEVTNLARALGDLRREGLWTVGLEGSSRQSLYDADLTVPLALVVGSEGSGLRRLTRERCDLVVSLPMMGAVESLNASVAGAIAMYEALRQRRRASIPVK